MSKSVNETLDALLGNLGGILNSKSVVGEPTKIGDTIIVPLVDISFGLGAGGADVTNDEKESKKSDVESAGAGLGATITPTAVIVISSEGVQLVNVKNQESVNKLIDMVPSILGKLGIGKTEEETIIIE